MIRNKQNTLTTATATISAFFQTQFRDSMKASRKHNTRRWPARWNRTVLIRLIADTKTNFEDPWEHGASIKSQIGAGVTSWWSQAQIHPGSRQTQLWCLWSTETPCWSNREPFTQFLRVLWCCRTWPVFLQHVRKAHFAYHEYRALVYRITACCSSSRPAGRNATHLERPWRTGKTERTRKDWKEDKNKTAQVGPEEQTVTDFEEDCNAVNQARA